MWLQREIGKEGSLLHNKIVFSMGDDSRMRFWKNEYVGTMLCDSFLSLYALAASKESWVVKVWDFMGEKGVGILGSLGLNDCEVEVVERFLLTIHEKRVIIDLEDRVLWKETKDEKFFVKSLYSVLELGNVVLFSRSIIWSFCVPTKVDFFAWEASWGKA